MSEMITIEVDGVAVEGVIVHRSGADIVVEITAPFSGLRQSRHLMNLARVAFPDGYLGDRGASTARTLLRDLYEVSLDLQIDWYRLRSAVVPYAERVLALLRLDAEEFMRRRRDLRDRLRRGEITNADHSTLQRDLQRERRMYEHAADIIKDEFVVAHLPMARCISLRDQVWQRLMGTVDSSKAT